MLRSPRPTRDRRRRAIVSHTPQGHLESSGFSTATDADKSGYATTDKGRRHVRYRFVRDSPSTRGVAVHRQPLPFGGKQGRLGRVGESENAPSILGVLEHSDKPHPSAPYRHRDPRSAPWRRVARCRFGSDRRLAENYRSFSKKISRPADGPTVKPI